MSDEAVLAAWKLKIPALEKNILMAVAHLCEENSNHCSATIKKISELSDVPVRTLYRHLDWLEKNKFLTRQKPAGWKIENTFTLTFQKPQKTGCATMAQRCANLAGLARAGFINQQPTTPAPPSAPLSGFCEPLTVATSVFSGSSLSLRNEAPERVNGKKNGWTVMKNGQLDAFNGTDLGIKVRGRRWRECDKVPERWLREAAEYLEKQTKFARINLRVEALKFENYWISRPGKGAAKINWHRTWMNWIMAAAQRAGYRPDDRHWSKDSSYQNDDDYGIGYRP